MHDPIYIYVHSVVCVCVQIQFLLKSMLQSKKKDHEFYEIKRYQSFMDQCKSMFKKHTFEHDMTIAGGTSRMLVCMIRTHTHTTVRLEYNEYENGMWNGNALTQNKRCR